MTDDIESKSTEANHARWHRILEEHTQEASIPRHGVLISELLGPDDGPHPTRGLSEEG